MRRRDLLKAIGVGGLLPFVKTEKAQAAPHEVIPQPRSLELRLPPDRHTPARHMPYMGSASIDFSRSLSGIGGTVSFSTDGATWRKLGEVSSWELTVGDE